MTFKKIASVAMALSLTASSFACSIDGKDGFMPENNMNIPTSFKSGNGMTEEKFNRIIDEVEAVYAPVIANLGKTLRIERNWTDGTVNAYAQQLGNIWKVSMFGGLARHPSVTGDGFAAVVCHELGHHLGGAPKKGGAGGGGAWGGAGNVAVSWASNEGQSDYWATLKCLRKVWINDNNAQIAADLNAPKIAVDTCNQAHRGNREDIALCIRLAMAGHSISQVLNSASKSPEFHTPDRKVVSSTNHNHPQGQCRLDTYYAGALCDVAFTQDVSDNDETVGTCNTATGHSIGTRPLCWFKPSAN